MRARARVRTFNRCNPISVLDCSDVLDLKRSERYNSARDQ